MNMQLSSDMDEGTLAEYVLNVEIFCTKDNFFKLGGT
jgi:hypothetical protein